MQQVLEEKTGIKVVDWMIYKNTPKDDIAIPEADIVVFTSPLNVDGYLACNGPRDVKMIAIGNTTANHLKQLEMEPAAVAAAPDEVSLADTVLSQVEVSLQ
mgnify:CR=1 FL=1